MTEATATVHDLVCHMDIAVGDAKGVSEYNGTTYYFCSGGCKVDFDTGPESVLKAEAEYDHSQASEMMMMMDDEPARAAPASSSSKKPWWRFWG